MHWYLMISILGFKMDSKQRFHVVGITFVFVLLVSLGTTTGSISEANEVPSSFTPGYLKTPQSVKLSKFSLTQKGYIQFLRYITDIPSIGDFTFCIWMKSSNFTYTHPLLSYSLHESERLIRAWVTPGGEEIRLAVKEIDIIRVPVAFKENQWYHICQSWSTKLGHWDLFLNGKLKSHGYNNKARGIMLPKGGDIVVGQEYTDFDKGLDDGIEGDIFGFNMVLSSTSAPQKTQWRLKELPNNLRRSSTTGKIKGHYIVQSSPLIARRRISKSIEDSDTKYINNSTTNEPDSSLVENLPIITEHDSTKRTKRQSYMYPTSFMKFYRILPQKVVSKPVLPYQYQPNQYAYRYQPVQQPDKQVFQPQLSDTMLPPLPVIRNKNSRIANDIPQHSQKPLGLQLIEMSYDCGRGRGAPLSDHDVLISWTKTPVRVFGGAILKKVDPFCY